MCVQRVDTVHSIMSSCELQQSNVLLLACRGVDAVADAVDHLQSGRSIGKVYVQIASDLPSYATPRL